MHNQTRFNIFDKGLLVVDDTPMSLKLMAEILSMIYPNIQIHTAQNGAEAFALSLEKTFGLIVTDWEMPIMTGPEFIANVRHQENGNRNTPVVIVSAKNRNLNVCKTLHRYSVFAFVQKPLSIELFIQKISRIEKHLVSGDKFIDFAGPAPSKICEKCNECRICQ